MAFFVEEDLFYNGGPYGLSGYLKLLKQNYEDIPDLQFNPEIIISDPPFIACRLKFDCTPIGNFLNLEIDGKRICFTENVFYEFRNSKILKVWSVIDKAAIEIQIS